MVVCEAHHAATAEDIIESCRIVRGVIRNTFLGVVDITRDSRVLRRKDQLIDDAMVILDAIKDLNTGSGDPWADPDTIAKAIETGILDAPHLKGNPAACGRLITRMVNGTLYAYDPAEKRILTEKERIAQILDGRKVSKVV